MDAPRRRRIQLLFPVAVAAATGCGLFDRETDKRVSDLLREEKPLVTRGQVPAGGPLPIPEKPAAPVVPLPSPTVAPVLPASGPIPLPSTGGPPVPQVSAPAGPVQPAAAEVRSLSADTPTTRVKVMATVGDTIITDDEVSLLMKQRANEYMMLKGDERDKKEREVYRDSLRMLVERELVIAEFVGKVKKVKPAALDELWEQAGRMADSSLREMRKGYKAKKLETDAEFAKELDAQGLPYKPFRRQVERAMMVDLFLGPLLREKNGTPTVADVHKYYLEHQADYRTGDSVKYLDLFVSTGRFKSEAEARKYADDLFKQAIGGADFVALVKQHGHGDSPLRDGLGVGEKRGEIQPPALEEPVFSIKPGNISGVIPTETGFHILKVTERQVAGVRPFDEKMQTDIRNRLMQQMAKAERDKFVAELWRKIPVTVVEP
jgi:peptidyl-prolyl cis-trans isomerase SurA